MASNLYEVIQTRNKQLAQFFDKNEHAARMVMKVVGMIARMATEDHFDASAATFEVFAPRGADVIVIKLNKPGG